MLGQQLGRLETVGTEEVRRGPSRRSFLQWTGVTAAGALALPQISLGKDAPTTTSDAPQSVKPTLKRPLGPREFRAALVGPIMSLPTTWNEDLTVNLDAVRNMVNRGLKYNVPIYELTAGNSKYEQSTFDEIKSVSETMIETVNGAGITIPATGPWPTEQVIAYAKFCEERDADGLQILLPKDVTNEDQLYKHFLAISESTRLPIVLHGIYSVPLLTRLAEIDSIAAMKEDGELTYYIDRSVHFSDRFEIFSGGAENRYLVGYPYGSKSFFSTYTGFAPDKPLEFWAAIQKDDLKQAVAITKKYDYPFISRFTHPFWHGTLEYFGLAKRFMRDPFKTLTDAEYAEIKPFFDGQGIDPADYQA
jgi:dihydrodipicolinate synthase/N-acetylneuraminate lyase